jgi:hypothetical protein
MNETKDEQHIKRVKTDTQQRDSLDEFPVHGGSGHINDPSSATAAARRAVCNRDGPPPLDAAHC